MVIRPSTLEGRVLSFRSEAEGAKDLVVTAVDGFEAIARPFRFEIELASKKRDVDSDEMLGKPATLVLKRPAGGARPLYESHFFHGILDSFEQRGEGAGMAIYHAELVPRLFTLSHTVRTRIFQEKTVPEIVKAVLEEYGLGAEDFDLGSIASDETKHPKREYVVQYQESDLHFLSRWLEHEGISYFFEHAQEEGGREKVVFTESMKDFPTIAEIPYSRRADSALEWLAGEEVSDLVLRHRRGPTEVVLTDYNYRKAGVSLRTSAKVESAGGGKAHEHGDHYKTPEEGRHLAKVRAEERECRERIFAGSSNCRLFRAGRTYKLNDHYRSDFDREYLLTEVEHHAEQGYMPASAASPEATYENRFVSVPVKWKEKELVFRPERVTPKPRVTGPINARVDAGGDYAHLDDEGRYRVRMPFDLADAGEGKATRACRMMQPYAGADYGMHFPLHKGTEVVIGCVDGDPDRPFILGAVPDSATASPVTSGNHTQCVISTGGGNRVVFEDQEGSQRIRISCPTENTFLSMGAPNDDDNLKCWTEGRSHYHVGRDQHVDIKGNSKYIVQQCVFRETFQDETNKVCGHKATTVAKDHVLHVKGLQRTTVEKDQVIHVGGNRTEHVKGKRFFSVQGPYHKFFGGLKSEMIVGAKSEVIGGAKVDIHYGVKVTLDRAKKIDLIKDGVLRKVDGSVYEWAANRYAKCAGRHKFEADKFEWCAKRGYWRLEGMYLDAKECRMVAERERREVKKYEATAESWRQRAKKARIDADKAKINSLTAKK